MSEDLLALFRKTGALLDGHFILRSGLHSRQYFQCAILLQHTDIAAHVCGQLADKLRKFECDTVISPALGGIIVGQEVGRSLGKRHIFVEKENGKLLLRRGFQISPDEKFIVVEDVVTRLRKRRRLPRFDRVADTRGFLDELVALLGELQREEVTPLRFAPAG